MTIYVLMNEQYEIIKIGTGLRYSRERLFMSSTEAVKALKLNKGYSSFQIMVDLNNIQDSLKKINSIPLYYYNVSYWENQRSSWSNINKISYVLKTEIEKFLKANIINTPIVELNKLGDHIIQEPCELFISNNVKTIMTGAFMGCQSISVVHIGENIEKIGAKAFYHCHNLKKIIYPDNCKLKRIGDRAFSDCLLTDAIVPNGVESIGVCAYSCNPIGNKFSKPPTLILPESVISIGNGAFSNLTFSEIKTNIPKYMIRWSGMNNVTSIKITPLDKEGV